MNKEPFMKMDPWYKGYQGQIEPLNSERIQVTGIYNVAEEEEDSLEITELPVGKWTRDYKNFLEELATAEEIDEIREHHKENRVHFWLKVPNLQKIIDGKDGGIEKKFKLTTTLSTCNYVLFDHLG
jgi:DNA topoisomerase-2